MNLNLTCVLVTFNWLCELRSFVATLYRSHRSTMYVDAAYCYRRSSVVCHTSEPCKTAEPIEMPFAMWTQLDPRKHVLDGGAHWHNLANMIERFMCGVDAAFLSNYFNHLVLQWHKFCSFFSVVLLYL